MRQRKEGGTRKTRRGKKLMIAILIIVAAVAAVIGGYALYGSAQIKKIPALTAQETLDYTLKGSKDAIVTVGVIENGQASYTVYGADSATLASEPHNYEIGSLTKTLTAALVCRAVAEGKISLDAPISDYLDLPVKAHYPTVGELVTHTSGYKSYYLEPIMISNRLKGRNNFYGIGDSMILDRLAKTDIADGEHGFAYSNFGYATLGLMLEKVYATEFTTLMSRFVEGELGLAGTRMSDEQVKPARGWDWLAGDTYMAAGAIVSNIDDMLKYAELLLRGAICGGENVKELKRVSATTPSNALMGIRMDGVAYGWMLDDELDIVWHNGGTGNYNSYIGLDFANNRAVVLLSNLAPGYRIPATVTGVKMLKELRGGDK